MAGRALVLTALTAFAGCGEQTSATPVKAGAPGQLAPVKAEQTRQLAAPFTVKTLGGKTFSLAAQRGKPVVVNFWASWCTPCGIEAPALEKIYNEYKGRGVEFIGIAVDDTGKDARRFVKDYRLTFPVVLDENGDVMAAYGMNIIPQTYVIGADGYVSYVRRGIVNEEELAKEIAKLIPPSNGANGAGRPSAVPVKKTAKPS